MPTSIPKSQLARDAGTSTFHTFSQLPKELRIMIWKLALPDSRIIFLRHRRLSSFRCHRVWSNCATDPAGTKQFFGRDNFSAMADHRDRRGREKAHLPPQLYGFQPQAAYIPLLYVCLESWLVATSVYTRAFGTDAGFPETWIDYKRDILYLDFDHPLEALSLNVKDVEKLAVCRQPIRFDSNTLSRMPARGHERFLAVVLAYFGGVKTLALVNPQHTLVDRGELVTTKVTKIRQNSLYFGGLNASYDRRLEKRRIAERLAEEQWYEPLFPFDMELFEAFRAAVSLKRGCFETPLIERKTITALETTEAYNYWMADCKRIKDRHRTVLYLTCQGQEDLKFKAGEMTNMEQLIEEFFCRRNISTPPVQAKILLNGRELNRNSTVYDLDLRLGTQLDILLCP